MRPFSQTRASMAQGHTGVVLPEDMPKTPRCPVTEPRASRRRDRDLRLAEPPAYPEGGLWLSPAVPGGLERNARERQGFGVARQA